MPARFSLRSSARLKSGASMPMNSLGRAAASLRPSLRRIAKISGKCHHAHDDGVVAHRRLPDDPAARAVEEIHQHPQLGTGFCLRGDFPARLLEDEPRAVQGLVGFLDRRDFFGVRSEEHTSELQSRQYLVCRLLLEKKKKYNHVMFAFSASTVLSLVLLLAST